MAPLTIQTMSSTLSLMSAPSLRGYFRLQTLMALVLVACGGDVGVQADPSGSQTGGSVAFATGGALATGGSLGFVTGTGGSGAASTLPTRCTAQFDPGYACNGPAPSGYFHYDSTIGSCYSVLYNGCGGSTSGGFTDLGTCQALCEQRPADASCPIYPAPGVACSEQGAVCGYNASNCLCTVLANYSCAVTDPRCSALGLNSKPKPGSGCSGETCTIVQGIVVMMQQVCTCTNGAWVCTYYYPY